MRCSRGRGASVVVLRAHLAHGCAGIGPQHAACAPVRYARRAWLRLARIASLHFVQADASRALPSEIPLAPTYRPGTREAPRPNVAIDRATRSLATRSWSERHHDHARPRVVGAMGRGMGCTRRQPSARPEACRVIRIASASRGMVRPRNELRRWPAARARHARDRIAQVHARLAKVRVPPLAWSMVVASGAGSEAAAAERRALRRMHVEHERLAHVVDLERVDDRVLGSQA